MPPAPPYVVTSWPTLIICAWLCVLVIVAGLVLAIVKTVISKTNANDVPQTLQALGPLLGGVVRLLLRGPLPLPLVPPTNPVQPLTPDSTAQSQSEQNSTPETQI